MIMIITIPHYDDFIQITYCIADSAGGGLTLQAVTPTQPMPEEEEVTVIILIMIIRIIMTMIIMTIITSIINMIPKGKHEVCGARGGVGLVRAQQGGHAGLAHREEVADDIMLVGKSKVFCTIVFPADLLRAEIHVAITNTDSFRKCKLHFTSKFETA